MTRAGWLALGLWACEPAGEAVGDSADDASEVADLSDVEWSMVGTWRGALPDDQWAYYIFTADRRGCFFDRDGDDFGRRFYEVHFVNWAVEVDAVDDDLEAPVSFDAVGGDHHDHDRYDMATDRLLLSGFDELSLSWQDVRIDCDDSGIDAVEGDVERLGWMAGDESTGGPPGPGSTGATTTTGGGGPTGGGTTGGTSTGGGPGPAP